MPQEMESDLESRASEQNVPWLREQLTNDQSGSLESATTEADADMAVDSSNRPTQPMAHPPSAPVSEAELTHKPAIVCADNEADERVGLDIGDALATSKVLEG